MRGVSIPFKSGKYSNGEARDRIVIALTTSQSLLNQGNIQIK